MDEEDDHSPSEFYYTEDLRKLLMQKLKSENTNKKTTIDMNILLDYMEAIGIKNEKIESLLTSELDHLLSNFFWTQQQFPVFSAVYSDKYGTHDYRYLA